MDILALLHCLHPTVTRTTLRHFSRIAHHEGACGDVGPVPVGRNRRKLSDGATLFCDGEAMSQAILVVFRHYVSRCEDVYLLVGVMF